MNNNKYPSSRFSATCNNYVKQWPCYSYLVERAAGRSQASQGAPARLGEAGVALEEGGPPCQTSACNLCGQFSYESKFDIPKWGLASQSHCLSEPRRALWKFKAPESGPSFPDLKLAVNVLAHHACPRSCASRCGSACMHESMIRCNVNMSTPYTISTCNQKCMRREMFDS